MPLSRKCEEANHAHARIHHVLHAPDELGLVPAFNEIADEKKYRLRRIRNKLFAVGHRLVLSVRAAAELHAENHIDRIVAALFREIDDRGVRKPPRAWRLKAGSEAKMDPVTEP